MDLADSGWVVAAADGVANVDLTSVGHPLRRSGQVKWSSAPSQANKTRIQDPPTLNCCLVPSFPSVLLVGQELGVSPTVASLFHPFTKWLDTSLEPPPILFCYGKYGSNHGFWSLDILTFYGAVATNEAFGSAILKIRNNSRIFSALLLAGALEVMKRIPELVMQGCFERLSFAKRVP
jgi:hypothetical protein